MTETVIIQKLALKLLDYNLVLNFKLSQPQMKFI